MPVINRFPRLDLIVGDLQRRLTVLERMKRPTQIVVRGCTNLPGTSTTNGYPQSGDMAIDSTTGFLWVFMFDGNTVTTQAFTHTTGADTFAVSDRIGFKPNQLIVVQASNGVYYPAQISSAYVATTGPGTITCTFGSVTFSGVAMTNPFSGGSTVAAPNPTTFNSGAQVLGSSWRQVVSASDLISRGGTFTGASGANSSLGSNIGGLGEVLARGYKPVV